MPRDKTQEAPMSDDYTRRLTCHLMEEIMAFGPKTGGGAHDVMAALLCIAIETINTGPSEQWRARMAVECARALFAGANIKPETMHAALMNAMTGGIAGTA